MDVAALTIGRAPFSLMVGTSVTSDDTEAPGGNNIVGDTGKASHWLLTAHFPVMDISAYAKQMRTRYRASRTSQNLLDNANCTVLGESASSLPYICFTVTHSLGLYTLEGDGPEIIDPKGSFQDMLQISFSYLCKWPPETKI